MSMPHTTMSGQLFMLCEHGEPRKHIYDQLKPDGSGFTAHACPGGHPVEGGLSKTWCEEHDAQQTTLEATSKGMVGLCWKKEMQPEYLLTDCRMVERFLIPLSAPKPEREGEG